MRILVSLAVLVCASVAVFAGSKPDQTEGHLSISSQVIQEHMLYLSDDLLRGREPGTAGYDTAADYVAEQFAKIGLSPMGDEGGFFQNIQLRQFALVPAETSLRIQGEESIELTLGDDYLVAGNSLYPEHKGTAPIVFVGNGIYDPAQGINDYAGLDVTGKYVAVLHSAPRSLHPDVRAHYMQQKAKMAAAQGALGAFILLTPQSLKVFSYDLKKREALKPRSNWLQSNGEMHDDAPGLGALVYLPPETSIRMFEGETHSFEKILRTSEEGAALEAFTLSKKADLEFSFSAGAEFESANVVAVWEGSDPELKGEYVVVSAHLDHLGVDDSESKDGIYNGLMDNASGVAVMLEVARKMAQGPAPGRTVVFVALTAEETGHIGSSYFASQPMSQGHRIVANVNLDMPFLFFPLEGVIAFGAEHSSLHATTGDALRSIGLQLAPDPIPEMAVFTKSDQYNFALEGVPAMTLQPDFGQNEDNAAKVYQFLASEYHQPSDQHPGLTVDYQAAAVFTEANYAVVRAIAESPVSPQWNAGNFFSTVNSTPHNTLKPLLDEAEVTSWATESLEKLLGNSWVPGATLAIVQWDKVISLQGVGTSNIETGAAIDPEKTLFRIGSISKSLTALAALRMVDKNLVDLDVDINAYLKSVHLEDRYSEAITLRDLLGHRAGFEGMSLFHMVTGDNSKIDMTAAEVQRNLVRVRPLSAPRMYDNMAFGVVGYVLQEVLDKPFREVVESELFAPLGMETAVVGLPDARWKEAASCHEPGGGRSVNVCPHALLRTMVQGAGDISVSAMDMANFMKAIISPTTALSEATAAQWLDFDAGRLHSEIGGMGLGIVELSYGNRRCLGHGGSIEGFISTFCVFPDQGVGVFLSINGNDEINPELSLSGILGQAVASQPEVDESLLHPRELIKQFFGDFADRFIPNSVVDVATPVPSTSEPSTSESSTPKRLATAALVGSYFRDDLSRSVWGEILLSLNPKVLSSPVDGELFINGKGPYTEKAPMYYEYAPPEALPDIARVAFALEDGELLMAQNGYSVNVRQPWYSAGRWTLPLLAMATLILLLAPLYSFVAKPEAYKGVLRVAGCSLALFLGGLLLELEYASLIEQGKIFLILPTLWRLLFPLAVMGFIYMFWKLYTSGLLQGFIGGGGGLIQKTVMSLTSLAALFVSWLAFHWGLVFLVLR